MQYIVCIVYYPYIPRVIWKGSPYIYIHTYIPEYVMHMTILALYAFFNVNRETNG